MSSFDAKIQVLIIDDSKIARRQLVMQLNQLGITQVAEAGDGLEGMGVLNEAQAQNKFFDLIVTDLRMPNMSGAEFLKAANSDPAFKEIPKIIVSVETDRSAVLDAVSAGADGYILKPVTNDILKAKLDRVLSRKKAG